MSTREGSKRAQNSNRGPRSGSAEPSESVLANLPRTRPQRASARREAARRGTATASNGTVAAAEKASPAPQRASRASAKPRRRKTAASATGTRARSTRTAAPKPRRARTHEPVPRQGFESDGEGLRGAVQPPGGAELFASAVEILGELTKSGVSSGERLVKDVLSRLSPS